MDDYRTCGFTARLFMPDLWRGSTAGFFVPNYGCGIVTFFGENDDLVMLVILVPRRRCPLRMCCRTRFGSCPVPFILDVEPAFINTGCIHPHKGHSLVVFRDDDFLGLRHDDRAGRSRDDFLRCGDHNRLFHDDRLLDDRRCRIAVMFPDSFPE